MVKMTFYQWINIEYDLVKKQYKKLPEDVKKRLKDEYNAYLAKEDNIGPI